MLDHHLSRQSVADDEERPSANPIPEKGNIGAALRYLHMLGAVYYTPPMVCLETTWMSKVLNEVQATTVVPGGAVVRENRYAGMPSRLKPKNKGEARRQMKSLMEETNKLLSEYKLLACLCANTRNWSTTDT